jgi:hypothetical protein
MKRGVEIRQRWIVKVDSIEAGTAGQPDLSTLDIKSDDVKNHLRTGVPCIERQAATLAVKTVGSI